MELSMPSTKHTECNEISLYTDQLATKQDAAIEVRKLASAFPTVDSNFVIVLIERLVANKFTKQRLIDAIGSVLDNCQYPPKISDIISFDRKVKVYTYSEMIAVCNQYRTTEDFQMIEINGKKRWIEK